MTPTIVYPGHPLVIAVHILENYESYDAANTYPEDKSAYQCPAALSDERIPGAGGCVYSALDILKCLKDGYWDVDKTIEEADKLWASIDGNAENHASVYGFGLEEAESLRDRFRAGVQKWGLVA